MIIIDTISNTCKKKTHNYNVIKFTSTQSALFQTRLVNEQILLSGKGIILKRGRSNFRKYRLQMMSTESHRLPVRFL